MDFSQRVVINTRQQTWQASPHKGVLRKPLAREEAERGHATSIVRYDAGASFTAHGHPLGEEILVLDGIFSDDKWGLSRRQLFQKSRRIQPRPL
jgi:anti-sigma factor ChrR (cupin superfamily)